MNGEFINAAPMSNMQGVEDDSTQIVPTEAVTVPQHLPKIYIYAQKGPLTPQLVSGVARDNMYGADSFNMNRKFANHATRFSNLMNVRNGAQMVQRVLPTDAGPKAAFRLYADVLPTMVQDYVRNIDGSIKVDGSTNLPVPVTGPSAKIAGYIVKFVQEAIETDEGGVSQYKLGTIIAGDQTDDDTEVQSQRYPIADSVASFFGSDGANQAMRMWAPTINSANPVNQDLLQRTRAYPMRFAMVTRANAKATGKLVNTMDAEQSVVANLKPKSFDEEGNTLLYAGSVFLKNYQNLAANPPVFAPFGDFYIYDANVKTLLEMFYAAELPVDGTFSDFTGEEDEAYKFNLFGGESSMGVPYHSYQIVSNVAGSVRLAENSNLYAIGGSDGTMSDSLFAALVDDAVAGYADETSYVQDMAKYPESFLWDTGFPMTTKKNLAKFISIRKDTAVVLATTVAGEPKLTAAEDSARATALKAFLQNYPESELFGTKTMRGAIIGRSGILVDESMGDTRVPLTFDLAAKVADYMGAGNGRWKSGYSFDEPPNNQVTMFRDVSVTFTPRSVKNKDWAAGMTIVESFDVQSLYYPAVHTVYENDTSVLTGFQTMVACLTLQKISEAGRRQFSGRQSLTNAQFAERLDKFNDANTLGIFDNKFITKSNTYFTAKDVARNYSYTNRFDLGAPGMKTVGTLSIRAKRIEDMAAAAT